MSKDVSFKDLTITRGDVLVGFEYVGEGYGGDYDPSLPDDKPLLRFWVCRKVDNDWEYCADSSYCTQIDARTSRKLVKEAANYIMDEVYDDASQGYSVKKICERLSWLTAANNLVFPDR